MSATLCSAKFERIEHIFNASGNYEWMNSHAANPTPVHLTDDIFRIFFSCRDPKNRSHVAFVDYDIKQKKIEHVCHQPVLVPGANGLFDDSGISPGCIIRDDEGKYRLYYIGWNLKITVPFLNTIGLAIGDTLDHFKKYTLAPVLDRNPVDPICLSYPWVIREKNCWRMWYGSTDSWHSEGVDMQHYLSHAYSDDGIEWRPTGHVTLPRTPEEIVFTRPCVVKENNIYKMWFTVRGDKYTIGYAQSSDGFNWQRGEVCLAGSGEGWDSDSVSYGSVFDHDGSKYLLYAGNKYGQTGFGIAQMTN